MLRRTIAPSILTLTLFSPVFAQQSDAEVPVPDDIVRQILEESGTDAQSCFGDAPDLNARGDVETVEPDGGPVLRRLIMALDASGSMAGSAEGQTKMEAAQEAALSFLQGVPEDVEVGLVAFGHRGSNDEADKEESCDGVEMVLEPGADGVEDALSSFSATGWTPLASALENAAGALSDSDTVGEQVIYVVSDGRETCGGDPVAVAQSIHEGPAKAIVDIIGYDLADEDREQLMAVAAAGGGTFTDAAAGELGLTLEERQAEQARLLEQANDAIDAQADNTNRTILSSQEMVSCVVDVKQTEMDAYVDWKQTTPLRDQLEYEDWQELDGAVRASLDERHEDLRDRADGLDAERRDDADAANEELDDEEEEAKDAMDDVGDTPVQDN